MSKLNNVWAADFYSQSLDKKPYIQTPTIAQIIKLLRTGKCYFFI